MPVYLQVIFSVAVLVLMTIQIVILLNILKMTRIQAANQLASHDQAHADISATAASLRDADIRRQTDDEKTGRTAVNTRAD